MTISLDQPGAIIKGPTYHAAINAAKAEHAAEAAALDFPWDVTSPEGLIAFFGEKLKQTNTELKGLIRAQENRGKLIKDVGLMVGMLVADKDLKPGMPDWPEFERLADLVKGSLGSSADAKAIIATLTDATKGAHTEVSYAIGNKKGQDEFVAAHPNHTTKLVAGVPPQVVMASDVEGAGLDAASAKELGTKLKALSENFQSDNQMDAIRVQELVGRISQIMSLASNILHKFDEAARRERSVRDHARTCEQYRGLREQRDE